MIITRASKKRFKEKINRNLSEKITLCFEKIQRTLFNIEARAIY